MVVYLQYMYYGAAVFSDVMQLLSGCGLPAIVAKLRLYFRARLHGDM